MPNSVKAKATVKKKSATRKKAEARIPLVFGTEMDTTFRQDRNFIDNEGIGGNANTRALENKVRYLEMQLHNIRRDSLLEQVAEDNYHEIDVEGMEHIKGFESEIILPKSKKEYINRIAYYQTKALEGTEDKFMFGYFCGAILAVGILLPIITKLTRSRDSYAELYHDAISQIPAGIAE